MNQVDPLASLKKQLEKTILRLESNEILQQMRNDESLAEFKRQHIRQIIQQELQLQPLVQKLNQQNNQLKGLVYQKDHVLREKTDEFVMELQNIEVKWEQFRVQKDKQRKQMQQKYLRQLQNARNQIIRLNKECQNANTVTSRLKRETQTLKEDRSKLEQNKATMEQEIRKLSKQLKENRVNIQTKTKQIEQKRLISSSEYEQTIQKMRQDMIYIKQCWRTQCLNIQNQLRQENQFLALQYEQKMRRELKEHAQNLKLGNNVVINDSEQIIAKRVQKIQQDYGEQMKKFEEEMHELSKLYQLTKEEIEKKEKINKQIKNKTHQYQLQMQKLKREAQFKMKSSKNQIEGLKQQLQNYQTDVNRLKKSAIQLKRQNDQIKQENLGLIKKQSVLTIQKQELRKEIQNNASKLIQLETSIGDLNKQLLTSKQQISMKNQDNSLKEDQIKAIKEKLLRSQQNFQQEKAARSKMIQSIKKQKQMIKKLVLVIDKLHLIIRKSKNQIQMIRQQVRCSFQMLKNKNLVEVGQIVDQFMLSREQLQRKHKQKMTQLLDQMETKQKELIEAISQQKQQLKNQNQQNQQLLQKKQNQIQKIKLRLQQSERQNKQSMEDLQRQKVVVSKLQKKIDENQLIYYNSINRVQKDIGRSLAHFHGKWSENVQHIQQDLLNKQSKIRSCFDKIDQLVGEVEDKNSQIQFAESQSKKYKKKYQQIRSERNEKIESLIKQLQKETKHKINLEKQLKQVRMSIMGGNSKITNFSFNDKERDYNVVGSYKKTDSSMKQQYSTDRDKEISQLKEMIAKTYKVFGQGSVPERDLSKNLSKRNIL